MAGNALPSQNGSAAGTTKSAISAGTVIITDDAGQQAKTGKSADDTIASLNRDTDNANGAIEKIFDQAQLQREQEERQVLSQVAQQAAPILYQKVGDKLVGQPTEVKVAVHALVGGVMSKLIGGDFGSGAAGAAAATLVVEKFGKDIEQIDGLSKTDRDALILLVGMAVGKVASAATGVSATDSNAAALTAKLATENNYLKHREITALAEKLKACDQAADPAQCRKSTWSDANTVGRDRQFRKCDDATQCRNNRDEIWTDRQELTARQEELGRKLYAGQLTKDEEQEYLINSQQLSLMNSAWEEANRQVREQIPFSEWTAAERAQTFQDAMVTLGALGAAGAVGSVRSGTKGASVVENNLLPHEVKQVEQLTSDLGGKFVGAPKLTPGETLNGKTLASSDYPVIDGWYQTANGTNVPVSLKELQSSNPLAILQDVSKANKVGVDYGIKNAAMYVDAPNMRGTSLVDFAANGPLTGKALQQGVIDTVVVRTKDGFFTITNGQITLGVPKGWK